MSAISGSTFTDNSSRRWRVLAGLVLLTFITIVDRVAISAAKNDMAAELRIPDVTFGVVFGAFALGYSVFMLPSGWLADRWGPRRFLTATVACWSLFTLGTGLASAVSALIAIRLLFGAAESGAFPTAARAIYNWLPAGERGLALGLLNTGSRMGAAIGLTVVSMGIAAFGWRSCFIALGVAGFGWAAWWFDWFRDTPGERDDAGPPERPPLDRSPHALVSLDSALLLAQYFASNFTFFVCFSWLVPYLRVRFGLGAQQAGAWASIPLYCGALATWTGGLAVDALHRRGCPALSRRLPAMAGFGLAAILLVTASQAQTKAAFVACFAITTFGIDFTLASSWAMASDLGGPRTGTLSAAMNGLGSFGAFASSVVFPVLLGWTGSLRAHFWLAAALDVAAIFCWWRMRPRSLESSSCTN